MKLLEPYLCFTPFNPWKALVTVLPLSAALIGNTVLHLDKALARIGECEHTKLKAEFYPRSVSAAGAGDVSNAARPSANCADRTEGTRRLRGRSRQLPPQSARTAVVKIHIYLLCL